VCVLDQELIAKVLASQEIKNSIARIAASSTATDEAKKESNATEGIEYNAEGDVHALAKKVLGTLTSLSPSEDNKKSSGHKQR
jgi:hypothetical protein